MLSLLPLLSLLLAPAFAHLPFEFGDGVDTLLSAPLDTSFSCEGRPYGYYADTANGCQVRPPLRLLRRHRQQLPGQQQG